MPADENAPKGSYPITGIPLQDFQKTLPTRQEITSWYNDPNNKYQVSLFMQALTEFKKKSPEDKLSYFQIAGIHCYPLVGWDGERPGPNPNEPDPGGYCTHNMVTFPTWHRPYMLLYEQVLHEIMLDLIKGWNLNEADRLIWTKAAYDFRLPYWDWARKQDYVRDYGIPQVCTFEKVSIIMPGPDSTPRQIPNPLVKFVNRNKDGKEVAMGDTSMGTNRVTDHVWVDRKSGEEWRLPWSKCVGTSRYAIREDEPESTWCNGRNEWERANAALKKPDWYARQEGGSLSDAIGRMLSQGYLTEYFEFASTKYNPPAEKEKGKWRSNKNFLSLEYVHNVVHNITGCDLYYKRQDGDQKPNHPLGLGHMSDVPVAAFDPIFWLHHCNIDRLFAMWRTLNPDATWRPPYPRCPNDDPDPDDSLRPFHRDFSGYRWTSSLCWDHTKLRYQYDDLVPPSGKEDPAEFRKYLRGYIKGIYPTSSTLVREIRGHKGSEITFDDYVINVVYDRYALEGRAYSILFFVGDPPSPLGEYRESKNFLGQIYTFSAPIFAESGATACKNCAQQQKGKILSVAQIPITIPLLEMAGGGGPLKGVPIAGAGDLQRSKVESVLSQGLKWKFMEIGGIEHAPIEHSETMFPNTLVALLRGQGTDFPKDDKMPQFGKYQILEGVTEKKPLGYGNKTALSKDLLRNDPGV